MRVASFPGGEDALNLGRVPSMSAERARFPFGEGASPVDVAASAANGEPVSPSSRNQKKHLEHSESMAFDMLFDSVDVEAPDMEDIEEGEEDYGDSDQDAHDPVSVYVRIVRQLSRPSSRVVQAIAKRFAAACAEVGPGEVGDAAHIDAVRRAFNAYDYDPWGEPVRRRPRSPESERSSDDEYGTYPETEHSGDQAFVATTPGAVGHAALLNLRHSFLWLKVDLEGDAALDPSAAPGDSLHPSGFAEAKAAAAISERAALAHAPVPIARSGAERFFHTTAHREETRLRGPTAFFSETETNAAASSGSSSAALVDAAFSPSTVLVMEPDIKAHFVISRPTPAYARLVDALPSTFVGTHQTLVRLVDFMCEQMNGSFRESGMSVPPWRKNKAILSKWFLPTATSRSHPATPSGSPERGSKVKKQDSGRRMSFDLVGGGDVVGVGVSYHAGGAFENLAPTRVPVGAGA